MAVLKVKEFRVAPMQFRVKQKVEIRIQETGSLQGSWQPATIIDLTKQSYRVLYDNLLPLGDGPEKLVEILDLTVPSSCSSRLRPLPPMVSFGVWDLPYGLCVDVLDNKVWREGVIFDHQDGSNERVVYLLDFGQETKTSIELLRISQDWDMFTGVWGRKGMWPLIEGYGKNRSLSELVKELSSPVLDRSDVITDAIPAENHLIDHHANEMKLEGEVVDTDDVILIDSDENSGDGGDVMTDCQKMNIVDSDKGSWVDTAIDCSSNVCVSNGKRLWITNRNTLKGRKQRTCKVSSSWVPVGPDLLPAAEFCPNAIREYASYNSQRPHCESLVLDARKHLAYIGWKIDCCKYGSAYKYRYTSPDNSETYFSLRLLCLNLSNAMSDAKESYSREQLRKRTRKHLESTQFPFNADLQKRSNQDQNASPPKQKRGKVMKVLKKMRDDQKQPSCIKATQPIRSSKSRHSCVLSGMIDKNLVQLGAEVCYRDREWTRGRITRDGIECDCCQKLFSLTGFEAHAGSTNHRPAANIILDDGRSLLDCQRKRESGSKKKKVKTQRCTREAKWKGKQHEQKDETDYICSVCHDAGDLVLCDQCPSTFHPICVGLENIPDGGWCCPPCCCDICGENKFIENHQKPTDASILNCDQCERKYHIGCLRNKGIVELERKHPKDTWFCSNKCRDIFIGLQNLMGKPIVVGPDNLTWTLLKARESCSNELKALSESHKKLNLALKVIHECFERTEEAYTGREIARDVIFSRGSKLNRLNFKGFYTVLLERNDEIITVANVRVFGDKVAEMPLVGTRFRFRRLGMCKILMDELEKQLTRLGVESLMLPAIPIVLDTWINTFGFSKLTDCERMQHLNHIFLDFPGTVKCKKMLTPSETTKPGQSGSYY